MIEHGRMMDAGFARIEEAKRNGLWDEAYTSKVKAPVPPDLEAALSENETAWSNFHNLANSHRNRFIHWLNTAPGRRKRAGDVSRKS